MAAVPWQDDAPRVAAHHGMTRARFEAEVVSTGRPAVLKGLVADWPAVAAARRSDEALADYLLGFPATGAVDAWFGAPGIAGRFGYADDLSGFNHERRTVPLRDLLAYLLSTRGDAAAYTAYMGGMPVPRVMPTLVPALPMPLLDPERDRLVSLWMGGATRTAAHWDVPQNLACVVAGRRRFILLPTEQVANLYVGPIDMTLAGQPSSLVDFAAPDLQRFPRFAQAMAAATVADLEPGDALYVPSLWWHHVEGRDAFGAMVNFWWRDGPDYMATPLFTMLHAFTTLRELPERERAAWRTMFDHYVFGLNGDPAAHLPEGAKGVLGPITPETLARLRGAVANQLRA